MKMENRLEDVNREFGRIFGEKPMLVVSPGRINLLGEHTDYNEGFVLPAAIDKAICFALAPSGDDYCRLRALDLNESHEFRINSFKPAAAGWPNYLLGVLDQLQKRGHELRGFNCVFGGDIPIGAGLSSSAALEAGLAFGLNELFGLRLEPLELVIIARAAENEYVGMRCGIMDQFINIFGRPGCALRLDCRSLDWEAVPLHFEKHRIWLVDSRIRHAHASSEYNLRRRQCEQAVAVLAESGRQVKSLRDADLEMLGAVRDRLEPVAFRRADYVIRENARLLEACRLLQADELGAFGALMFEAHAGMRDDFEISCPELDLLVETARESGLALGARLMGGGFAGCSINLVEESSAAEFREVLSRRFRAGFGREPLFYPVNITGGTHKMGVKS